MPVMISPRVKRWSGRCTAAVASGSLVVPVQKPRWISSTASAIGLRR